MSQALKMPYFSNKPAPTPSHLLPRPRAGSTLTKEEERSLKRKIDNPADLESGNHDFVCYVLQGTFI